MSVIFYTEGQTKTVLLLQSKLKECRLLSSRVDKTTVQPFETLEILIETVASLHHLTNYTYNHRVEFDVFSVGHPLIRIQKKI